MSISQDLYDTSASYIEKGGHIVRVPHYGNYIKQSLLEMDTAELMSSRCNEEDIAMFLWGPWGHKASLRHNFSSPMKAENGSNVMSWEVDVQLLSLALKVAFCMVNFYCS